VLALVALSPWGFAGNEPVFGYAILAGVSLLMVLWAALAVLEGRVGWRACPAAALLAGLFLLTAAQVAPLPDGARNLLSPRHDQLVRPLLPERPEVLSGESGPASESAVPASLSLDPAETRSLAVRLLAVFLVFACVRYTLPARPALRRLGWVLVANSALLALVGIAQSVSSPKGVVYWSFPTEGAVFGPFICRNHFADYANFGIGLGAGLLLAGESGRRHGPGGLRGAAAGLLAWLQAPRQLWLLVLVVAALAGVGASLSRGGVLATLAAGAAAAAAWVRLRGAGGRTGPALLALGVGLAVAAAASWGPVEERLGGLTTPDGLSLSRWALWASVAPELPHYWLAGSGGGTFQLLEPLRRTGSYMPGLFYDHAHNEYLEALLEGGLPRLALTLALAGYVLARGLRALARHPHDRDAGLVLGAWFGLLALALHSAVDFGVHMPAVALTAAVAAALMLGVADEIGNRRSRTGDREEQSRSPVAVLSAGVLVVAAVLLFQEGWRIDRAERLRLAGEAAGRAGTAEGRDRAVAYLRAAVRVSPGDARYRQGLALAYLDAYHADPTDAAADRYLRPGLKELCTARDLCPLLAKPHPRLALHSGDFARADPAARYLERACFLRPFDADLWYAAGLQALLDGTPDRAWPAFRRSLELSDRHLFEVAARALPALGPGGVAGQLLPGDPDVLAGVADRFFPDPDALDFVTPAWLAEAREPFLARAVAALDARPGPRTAEELRRRGLWQNGRGRADDALADFAAAVAAAPRQPEWRYEYARLLNKAGRYAEAKRQLDELLAMKADSRPALDLREAVERDLQLSEILK
jgi:O-antigen ligase